LPLYITVFLSAIALVTSRTRYSEKNYGVNEEVSVVEEANELDKEARKMDVEVDAEANKMDKAKEARQMDHEVDEEGNKMDEEANEVEQDKNLDKQAGSSNKADGIGRSKRRRENRSLLRPFLDYLKSTLGDQMRREANLPMRTTQCCQTPDCRFYEGTIAITKSGKGCLPWKADDKKKLNSRGLKKHPQNFCRKLSSRTAGCRTLTNGWEDCEIPKCSEGCCSTYECTDYRGTKATSASGKSCLPWTDPLRRRIDGGWELPESSNVCRNPEVLPHAWCLTANMTVKGAADSIGFCDIPLCTDQKCLHFNGKNFFDLTPLSTAYGGETLVARHLVNKPAAFPIQTFEFTPCGSREDDVNTHAASLLRPYIVRLKERKSENDEEQITGIGSAYNDSRINGSKDLELLSAYEGGFALKMIGMDIGTSTIIKLNCDESRNKQASFDFIKEEPAKTYIFSLTHAAACPERVVHGSFDFNIGTGQDNSDDEDEDDDGDHKIIDDAPIHHRQPLEGF